MRKLFRAVTAVSFLAFACAQVQGVETIVVPDGAVCVYDGTVSADQANLVHSAPTSLFHVKNGGKLVLMNLTITGNGVTPTDDRIGAIYNEGTVFASNCVFTSMTALNGCGAVYSDRGGAHAVFMQCTFRGNKAAEGGAIAACGSTVVCSGSTFYDNKALISGNQPGGAVITMLDRATVSLVNCTVVSNLCLNAAGAVGIADYGCELNVYNSAVMGNGPEKECAGYKGAGDVPAVMTHAYVQIGNTLWGMLSSVNNFDFESQWLEDQLGPVKTRVVNGVTHSYFTPYRRLRKLGMFLYRNDTWSAFSVGASSAQCTICIDLDQLGEPTRDVIGARSANILQDLIDATPSGEVCNVPPGIYDTAVVDHYNGKDAIKIVGAGADSTVIDGDNMDCCIYASGRGITVKGVKMINGNSMYDSDSGGAIRFDNPSHGNRVEDCVIENCTATYGGAIADADVIVNTSISGCRAETGAGGAVYCGSHYADISNCVFNDNSSAGNGGAVCYANLSSESKISKCTFTGNTTSACGGAIASGPVIENCTFTGNSAAAKDHILDGGATYGCKKIIACTYRKNTADRGGASFGDEVVISSLFYRNKATLEGGAASMSESGSAGDSSFYNCTFLENYADDATDADASGVGGKCDVCDSVFYRSTIGENCTESRPNILAQNRSFYDYSGGDYHLALNVDPVAFAGSTEGCAEAKTGARLDIEGTPLVTSIGGTDYYYKGCYAFAPVASADLVVTGPADSYPNTNLRTSLRDAVDKARAYPQLKGSDGKYTITFADDLFDENGVAVISIGQSQIDLSVFTNGELVVSGPADKTLIIDGGNMFRAFRVRSGNMLGLENLTFRNFFGSEYGISPSPGFDGGAILNYGKLTAVNCAFRNCSAGHKIFSGTSELDYPPSGFGGAIYNGESGTARISHCTFADCKAARGGGMYNADGGFATIDTTTFSSNKAIGGDSHYEPAGGAYAQDGTEADTLFVNCTVAGNSVVDGTGNAGGGVHVSGAGENDSSTIHFLSSVIVGNQCGNEANDISVVGNADLVYTKYGSCVNPATHLRTTESDGGKGVAEIFAKSTTVDLTSGVLHSYYPLREGGSADGAYAWIDGTGENAGWATSSALPTTVIRGTLLKARKGGRLTADQLGNEYTGVPPVGAVAVSATSENPDLPSSSDDSPLIVNEASEAALKAAIAYANANPSAAIDGVVTVKIDESLAGASITLTSEILIDLCTDRTLLIEGAGITVSCSGCRAFHLAENNRIELRDITVQNGSVSAQDSIGGGLYAEPGSYVTASNLTFSSCSANLAGGGVAIEGNKSKASFTDCTFAGCSVTDGFGGGVYRETADVEFINCTFSGNSASENPDVDWSMRVKIERADGTTDFYDEVAPAVASGLEAGDTLVILSTDCGSVDEFVLPPGVTVRDESNGGAQKLMSMALASAQELVSVKKYFSVVATPNSVSTELNDAAAPTLDNSAMIDLTSDDKTVSAIPGNVKPGLWYGLGYCSSVTGPFEVGKWIQADANGILPEALTAPKVGGSSFYRVVVRSSKP